MASPLTLLLSVSSQISSIDLLIRSRWELYTILPDFVIILNLISSEIPISVNSRSGSRGMSTVAMPRNVLSVVGDVVERVNLLIRPFDYF